AQLPGDPRRGTARCRGSTPGRPPSSVGQGRVELPTSRLSGVRSNHLSYWPGVMPRASFASVLTFRSGGADASGCARVERLERDRADSVVAGFAVSEVATTAMHAALAPWKLNRTLSRLWVLT